MFRSLRGKRISSGSKGPDEKTDGGKNVGEGARLIDITEGCSETVGYVVSVMRFV